MDAMQKLGVEVPPAAVRILFQTSDLNGDGMVDFSEFVELASLKVCPSC